VLADCGGEDLWKRLNSEEWNEIVSVCDGGVVYSIYAHSREVLSANGVHLS